jgi:hypothetical protein
VLVITTVDGAGAAVDRHVRAEDTVKVVVPVVGQGVLDWLANDQRAFTHAELVAERTAAEVEGATVDAVAGESDVGLAIQDALATFPADELVVAVSPDDERSLRASLGQEELSLDGLPIRVVIVTGT